MNALSEKPFSGKNMRQTNCIKIDPLALWRGKLVMSSRVRQYNNKYMKENNTEWNGNVLLGIIIEILTKLLS